ncbi:winged helix-turn-helix transcriptional regulator [Dankookia sp. GCM10030260]|uniref:winged helix-turn-helix transcriptional regulator n=1 Tax=Dankookia sp. GCM10030260 TaxID=3273390 RepID=UPI00360994E8
MGRTDFTRMRCPVARSMAVLGERWAMLVLREAFYGTTRFDEFERHLGIAPNILSARLRDLTAHGLLEKTPGPGARHEYRLTEKGHDFFPAYLALKAWADRWMCGPDGPAVLLEEAATGRPVQARPVLSAAGTPLRPEDIRVLPGPGAGEALRARFGGEASHG